MDRSMDRGRVRTRSVERPLSPFPPAEHPSPVPGASGAPGQVLDQMEREQEGIVNKLHREINTLREGGRSASRSRSRSRSSSVSSQSQRPLRPSISEHDTVVGLRRENDLLRRKVTDLTVKLAERDIEIERLKNKP